MNQAPPGYAKNKSDLAAALGISYGSLTAFLNKRGAPVRMKNRGYPIKRVREFCERHAKSITVASKLDDSRARDGNALGGDADSTVPSNWRARRERAAALKAEHDLQVKARDFILWVDYEEIVGKAISEIQTDLRRTFESTLPSRCEGLTGLAIRKKNADALDKILKRFKNKLAGGAEKMKGRVNRGGRPVGS